MVSEHEITSTIAKLQGSGKTFAEFLVEIFKDKIIEVYVGDTYEDINTEQVSVSYPAVFCGKLIAAYRECLILNCAFTSGRHLQFGNIMFINERAIRALNEIDGKGILKDMMLRSEESLDVKEIFDRK